MQFLINDIELYYVIVVYRNKIKKEVMFNKKICVFTAIFALLCYYSQSADAVSSIPEIKSCGDINIDVDTDTDCIEGENSIIKRVTLRDKFKKTPEAQISAFLKKYNKYSSSANIEKLKDLYTDSYINNDGFNKNTVIDMMIASSDAYKNVKYETEIINIEVNGDYAVVKVKETAQGETAKKLDKVSDTGFIVSEIYYTDYLQKYNNQWKISATDVHYEKVYLKYGEAKYMDIDITSPDCVPADSEYEVGIKTILPGGSFVVGSIVNEDIVYPQENKKDVYRSVKSDSLTRILRSNNNNHNEYATVSIAITRANVNPPAVMLDMTGAAFIMKRVNVFSARNNNTEKEE